MGENGITLGELKEYLNKGVSIDYKRWEKVQIIPGGFLEPSKGEFNLYEKNVVGILLEAQENPIGSFMVTETPGLPHEPGSVFGEIRYVSQPSKYHLTMEVGGNRQVIEAEKILGIKSTAI